MPDPGPVVAVLLLSAAMATRERAQTSPAPQQPNAPQHLRCEYMIDPLGIERVTPRLSWEMVDARRGAVQTAWQLLAADAPELLDADQGNLWDSGKVDSDQSVHVVYAGRPLRSRMQIWWKVRVWDREGQPSPWSEPARWSMGLLDSTDWQARWIGDSAPLPPGESPQSQPALMLRKSFQLPAPQQHPSTAPVKRATIYATALGLYELRLNGQRVGDHLLAPEWTDYHKRVQYQTCDVTHLLRPGENVIAGMLGDGWYAGRVGLAFIVRGGPTRAFYGRRPWLLAQLEIELADGRAVSVVSNEDWRITTEGPIRASDILDGEVYDARRDLPGWDAPGFDDSAWRPAAACATDFAPQPAAAEGSAGPPCATSAPQAHAPELVAQPNEPIRVVAEITPIALTEPQPGVYVYDLGQNIAGWCRMKLSGPAGTTVTFRYAEVLNPDGTIYTANLRAAPQMDQYTLRGSQGGGQKEAETFEPHFTYHGFRYVEVSGLPEKPALDALTGRVFCSAAPVCGHFECSDPLLNKLMKNIVWTQRANMPSIPTDCPQRDERLGWMGDILAFAQAGCFNLDMAAFFTKWLPDVRDAQADDGRYPDFAPHPFDPNVRFSAAPAWADAGVFVPWCAYVNYADERLLAEHFESARRWIDWVHANNPDLLWKNKRGNDYGDWLNADTLKLAGWPAKGAEVPKEVFATMFFARSTQLLSQMAAVLGREDDARRYAALAGDIRTAFVKAYVGPDGRMPGDTQAGYAIALHFDLVPDELQPAAVRHMLAAFERYNGHISTGFHSTICLMNELNRAGLVDQAYRLLTNRGMPSWLYPVEHGATTIWERWDGYVADRGFQDPGMNSFSHYAFGCVGEWMYRTILGLNPDPGGAGACRPEMPGARDPSAIAWRPGYKHFTLRPRPGGGLTWARGEYHSLHGKIVSNWRIENGRLRYECTIPANTSATVYVPTSDPASVQEEIDPAATRAASEMHAESGAAVFELGAGTYRFVSKFVPPVTQPEK